MPQRVTTLAQAAKKFLDWGVTSDQMGNWLFSNGDKVAWCAGFVQACAQASGNWMANSPAAVARLRTVSEIVRRAEKLDCIVKIGSGSGEQCAQSLRMLARSGMLLAVSHDQDHIGVVIDVIDAIKPRPSLIVIHGNSGNDAVEVGQWSGYYAPTLIVIPEGGW